MFAVKTCAICRKAWTPTTRYQAARNQTCGLLACKAKVIGDANKGNGKAEPTIPCAACGTLVHRPLSRLRRNKATYCSQSCRAVTVSGPLLTAHKFDATGTKREPRYGADNPAWKGGITLKRAKGNYKGVRYTRAPLWALPMARKDGYIMEHRLVMAQMCGFLLTRAEVVDHQDHNPANNLPGNLLLYPTNADHKRGEAGRFVSGVANRLSPRVLGPL